MSAFHNTLQRYVDASQECERCANELRNRFGFNDSQLEKIVVASQQSNAMTNFNDAVVEAWRRRRIRQARFTKQVGGGDGTRAST